MKNVITMLVMLLMIAITIPAALAIEEDDGHAGLDVEISPEDRARFDAIMEPVIKIYNFIKYVASVVAVIFLLYAGISFMTSGSDPKKRDQSKNIAMYVIIGLLIIWAAPMIVELLI